MMIDLTTVKPGDMLAVEVADTSKTGVVWISGFDGALPVSALHPLPTDPHAALRDAVVEAARDYYAGRGEVVALRRVVDALNAAMAPPDPVGELLKQASGAVYQLELQKCPTGASLLRAAIRAVEAMRREG